MVDFAPIALILESAGREWNPKHGVDLTDKLMHSCHSLARDLRTWSSQIDLFTTFT